MLSKDKISAQSLVFGGSTTSTCFTAGLFWIFQFFLQLHIIKLANYMLIVICLILYKLQCEDFLCYYVCLT